MEMTSSWNLAARKDAYRLWFEYLKVARSSVNKEVKAALARSAKFYEPWEMDKADKFDAWWKGHRNLFEEPFFVRELKHGEMPLDPAALVVEVPLTQSPTILTKRVRAIIQDAVQRQQKALGKGKTKANAHYHLTDRAEPKLATVKEMLCVYRDVYLKNPNLHGGKRLDAVHRYYLGDRENTWQTVPMQFRHGRTNIQKITALRNVNRYIQKAKKIVFNVALGEFPGKY
jgi:hypothetical protein